jgi:aspartokinase
MRREVWKLGGSVLTDDAAFADFATRVADKLAQDAGLDRLYLVVSAMRGVTEALIDSAVTGEARAFLRAGLKGEEIGSSWRERFDCPDLAAKLLLGEVDAAHRLRRALVLAGVQAKLATQFDFFPIACDGGHLHAELDLERSRARFRLFERICAGRRLVIVTGFGAVTAAGEPALLGRNASDYVAAILSRLDPAVREVIFAKDVPGIFENWQSRAERLIDRIEREDLSRREFGAVLDRRVLDIIACPFTVTGAALVGGTQVLVRASA